MQRGHLRLSESVFWGKNTFYIFMLIDHIECVFKKCYKRSLCDLSA